MPINITKSTGEIEPFNPDKVRASMRRIGADESTIEQVMKIVRDNLEPKMSTKKIYQIVRRELKKSKPWAAARYNLREAIVRMGPAGFNFEKYVASILDAYGYDAKNPGTYQGACVTHETDVTAEKEGRTAFIEAKFRHDFSTRINIKDTMSTWARFLDLVDGSNLDLCPHFDEAWIVTNARFSDQSLEFGHCKNMKLIGWSHPSERTFAQMVDLDALYPITVIEELKKHELEKLSQADLMLCRELVEKDEKALSEKTGIKKQRLSDIRAVCEGVVKGDG